MWIAMFQALYCWCSLAVYQYKNHCGWWWVVFFQTSLGLLLIGGLWSLSFRLEIIVLSEVPHSTDLLSCCLSFHNTTNPLQVIYHKITQESLLADVILKAVLSLWVFVQQGFEPVTSCMVVQSSNNWANKPDANHLSDKTSCLLLHEFECVKTIIIIPYLSKDLHYFFKWWSVFNIFSHAPVHERGNAPGTNQRHLLVTLNSNSYFFNNFHLNLFGKLLRSPQNRQNCSFPWYSSTNDGLKEQQNLNP